MTRGINTITGVSLEAGYRWSTAAYVASHRQLLNLTSKRVYSSCIISSTETGRNNYESLTSYFNLQLYGGLLITYGRLLKKLMKLLHHLTKDSSLGSEDDYRSGSRTINIINNSLFEDYSHPDNHARQRTDTPGFISQSDINK